MSAERINGCKINLELCSTGELEGIQKNLGQLILEREWELSLVITELDSRKEVVVE